MKMSRELDPGSTEVVRIESEGEMESVVSGPFEEKDVDEGEFPLYFECACFCPVFLTLSSCVVSGTGVLREPFEEKDVDEGEFPLYFECACFCPVLLTLSSCVVSGAGVLREPKSRGSPSGSESESDEGRVSARERSRSASVSLATETPKRAVSRVSRDIACGSDDDQIGRERIAKEGELYLENKIRGLQLLI